MNYEQSQGGQAVSEYEHNEHLLDEIQRLRESNFHLREGCEEQKQRIKRLEEAGNELSDCADQIGWTSCESPQWIKKAENAVKEWLKAKEAKL
jgi:DNA-binding transcriptional MerR regulator